MFLFGEKGGLERKQYLRMPERHPEASSEEWEQLRESLGGSSNGFWENEPVFTVFPLSPIGETRKRTLAYEKGLPDGSPLGEVTKTSLI